MSQINFTTTPAETELIHRIAQRARREITQLVASELLDTEMDVTAVHCNGCPLLLEELLAGERFDFAHDILGIASHLDRRSGKLVGGFLPRFAKPLESETTR